MTEDVRKKECFVICTFGQEGTPERDRSNDVLDVYIKPAAEPEGYRAFRSIDLEGNQPGVVTENVIDKVCNADLLIADLTGSNANVYYELALRHALAKPFIMLIEDPNELKFDVQGLNVIIIRKDLRGSHRTIAELRNQIQQVKQGHARFDNTISRQFPHASRSAKVFSWNIRYEQHLAANWLKHQEVAFQECAKLLDTNRGIPTDPGQRNLLAHYVGYKFSQGQNLLGHLYYEIKDQGGSLQGWGNFLLLGSDPLHIPITGQEISSDEIIIHFMQPARSLEIAPGIIEVIPPFNFLIHYVRKNRGLEGIINHPDFSDPSPLQVGTTRLSLIE